MDQTNINLIIRVLFLSGGLFALSGCNEESTGEERHEYKTVAELKASTTSAPKSFKHRCVDLAYSAEPHEAVSVCLQEAKQGNLAAEVLLGDLYAKSFQWTDAVEWYQVAAKHGAPYAQLQLAKAYLEGKGIKRDSRAALTWILSSAKLEYSPSQLMLAKLYHEGTLIEKNEYVAFQWYLACAKDQPEAAFQVGIAYLTGQMSQAKNLELAIPYLNYAAEKQYSPAQIVIENLALEGKKADANFTHSIEYFREDAKKGSPEAQVSLAKALMQFSIPQYDKAAFYWVTQSAMKGNQEAKYLLGQFYDEGIGTPVDYDRAFAILSELALMGHPLSQYRIGKMYYEGHGVEQDDYLGKKWIMTAADQGVEEAKTLVDIWEKEAITGPSTLEAEYRQEMPVETSLRDDVSENDYENAMGPY